MTLSPALQSWRSESASSGGTGIACRAGSNATEVRGFRGVASAAPREAAVGQWSSAWLITAIGYSQQNIACLNTLGQVLRAIDLPLKVGGDFNLAGDGLEQSSGWLHAAPAQRQGQRSCTHLSERWWLTKDLRTHRPVVPTLGGKGEAREAGPKGACQAPKDCTSWPVEKVPELR